MNIEEQRAYLLSLIEKLNKKQLKKLIKYLEKMILDQGGSE